MTAARLLPDADTLVLQQVPVPVPDPGWALVQVRAAGLCHTDLHLMAGLRYSAPNAADYTVTLPRTLGHEVAGVVTAVGAPEDDRWLGAAVAVGRGNRGGTTPGMHFDGGFAQYCAVPVDTLVPIPDGVDFDVAAVATDAVSTAYSAVRHAGGVEAGDRVAVIGLGGLGLSAVRIAALTGATVFGVDIDPARHAPAAEAGCRRCVTDVRALDGEKLTVVVDLVGGTTTGAAVDALQPGGRVALVGMSAEPVTLSSLSVVLGRKSVIGSLGSRPGTLAAVLDLISTGQLTPAVEVVPFAGLADAFERLHRGKVSGRLVTRPQASG
jgi:alcohol dehydrogenase, propanol-preferring